MAIMRLDPDLSSGDVYVKGDGLEEVTVDVSRDVPIRTVCGTWVWNADGQYYLNVRTKRSSLIIRYFARRRGEKQGAFTCVPRPQAPSTRQICVSRRLAATEARYIKASVLYISVLYSISLSAVSTGTKDLLGYP